MRVSSKRGSPTRIAPSSSARSCFTDEYHSCGTSTRRMAVHFWPAFCVMSRTTSLRNSSYMSLRGSTSGPSTAAFRLSASMLIRTDCRMTV